MVFETSLHSFLLHQGMLLGFGVEILGIGKNGIAPIVRETERFREYGLEKNYLVIRTVDEWIYCLNNNSGIISSWDRGTMIHTECASCLEEYILNELSDAKEEWE